MNQSCVTSRHTDENNAEVNGLGHILRITYAGKTKAILLRFNETIWMPNFLLDLLSLTLFPE